MTAQLVVVGLDGATWDVLDPLIEEGRLPTLARLKEEGASGTLESVRPPISCPAWFCYSTGKNPGKLGIYGWRNVDPVTKTSRFNDYTHLEEPEVWDYLGAAGFRSAVINIPTMFPPKEIEGYMVSGMQAQQHQEYTHPPELKDELEERFGYRVSPDHKIKWDREAALEEAFELFPKRFDAARYLLDKVDLLHVTVFHIDEIQHNDWGGEDLEEAWELIDEHLGDFLDDLPEDTDVLVMSDHGFTQRSTKFYVNTWLEQNGYQARTENRLGETLRRVGVTRQRVERALKKTRLLDAAKAIVPERLQHAVKEEDGTTSNQRRLVEVDWDETVAFASTNFTIHVLDEDEIPEIIEKLEQVTGPDGEPVFEEVLDAREVLHGHRLEQAPQILLLPADGFGTEDPLGHPLWEQRHPGAAGHDLDGIVLAHGPSFEPGAITDASLVDLAPTILHAFELPVPEDIDGDVLDVFADAREVRRTDELAAAGSFAEGELEGVEERLRGLGYLE